VEKKEGGEFEEFDDNQFDVIDRSSSSSSYSGEGDGEGDDNSSVEGG